MMAVGDLGADRRGHHPGARPRKRATPSCGWRRTKSSGWPSSPSASASRATCTIVLGHTLSVVVLKSELAQKLMTRDPARALQEMAEVERIARDGLAEVREAITGYRSSGLAAEIEHVRDTLIAAGIDATIEARPVPLAPAQETALSLALREAATNVIRHAARDAAATSGSTRRTARC